MGCSIQRLLKFIAPTTPLHIYVFTYENASTTDEVSNTLMSHVGESKLKDILCVLPISVEQWTFQPQLFGYKADQAIAMRDYISE
jgi:hypothetical protein